MNGTTHWTLLIVQLQGLSLDCVVPKEFKKRANAGGAWIYVCRILRGLLDEDGSPHVYTVPPDDVQTHSRGKLLGGRSILSLLADSHYLLESGRYGTLQIEVDVVT